MQASTQVMICCPVANVAKPTTKLALRMLAATVEQKFCKFAEERIGRSIGFNCRIIVQAPAYAEELPVAAQ